ncbi:putative lipid II flippase FtsW [Mycolicibacterium thermoresistibile]|uniref:Probable peptidoglycan glycosyltransferase FtsW n=2 Tax=Mycolicibacterium thermoresistibile TaxID=1797 RepID=G7CMG9_MYCT3|nr:putative lipid II flippase FtsW [Mycolicibacterium thermoresistibile]EHI10789.1 cell division protein FtsW [Mycolicibacterium thermoresistibile ATCC 19527]MCV7190646.1 putative lipid II flippase FtsW [Mycolicibacterium thermoresistibile]GAT16942.1 cell division protein FtsW [Mycolicibacterium thermoresistibile]SNW18067.1 cell division-specific peptidoglycan biosynthesis regulator FtsW [Mycolicibacterium thermoresistibile]
MSAILDRLRHRRTSPAADDSASEPGEREASGPAGEAGAGSTGRPAGTAITGVRTRISAWIGRPMTSFHLIIAVTALLTLLGLTMVLSASGVRSYGDDGSPWAIFSRQVLWTLIGLVAFYVAVRTRIRVLRRFAFAGYLVTIVLLILVLIPGIGTVANGSRGWFVFGSLSMQPSEVAKISLALWGAHLLAARRMERASLREMLIPLVPATVVALALIAAQPDLGHTVSLGIILLALLWYAGLPLRVFVSSLVAIVAAAAVLAMAEGYRSVRVQSWLNPNADPQGAGYQARQARFALANGGFFGEGLGQGTAKWNYLPEAHNDFIFAIIGEELGFVGAMAVLCLFGLFAYTGMRIARRSVDPFLRLFTATATMWLLSQVFINVGYVVGLLPVTGLQLPLISAGGTASVTTLFMMGLIANAARHEPEAVAALRAGRDDRVNRWLRLPLPEPYAPTRLEAARDRLRSRPGRQRGSKQAPRQTARTRRAAVRTGHPADRPARRSGHHGGGRRSGGRVRQDRTARRSGAARSGAGQRQQGRRARALEGRRQG